MNHIELFAGCGGLSLGLEQAGFELTLANELSPMAGETFAFNLLNEDLEAFAQTGEDPQQAYWLSSQYKSLSQRLRENPFEYPELGEGETDIPANPAELQGKLVIGNIIQLNQLLESNNELKEALRDGFGEGGVDLVSGGPPCQSFSLAGLRKKDCDKNTLPWEFANFVEHVQPKVVLLENVTGILRAFKDEGESYHAWFELAKAFAGKGYVPLCLHVNARFAGVPQNRPRFIMIAIKESVYEAIKGNLNDTEKKMFSHSEKLFCSIKKGEDVPYGEYPYFDAQKKSNVRYFQNSFLHPLTGKQEVTVSEAIDDIKFSRPNGKSLFVENLNASFAKILGNNDQAWNHDKRQNTPRVQRRFRIYQVLQQCGKDVGKEVFSVLKQQSNDLSEDVWKKLKTYQYLYGEGELKSFGQKAEFLEYLSRHATKKQTQKALCATEPAPAALSIPDDACHYDEGELRNLTVREMARIQSFPDNFQFRSKVTTGGKMRRFEVPQYTQVGNAVPPLLGAALGETIKNLLEKQ